MGSRIEWVLANQAAPIWHTAESIENLAPDGNAANHIGLWVGDEDGVMLYGTLSEMVTWLEQAVNGAKDAERYIHEARLREVTAIIKGALSRDDETDFGSIFEDKVQVIRNLNVDAVERRDDLNYEYARGQVELVMDTTDWLHDQRPEKEDVFYYIFHREM